MKKILSVLNAVFLSLFILVPNAYAHEAYVLTKEQFNQGLKEFSPNPIAPLLDPATIQISLIITVIVVSTYFLTILWSTTKWSESLYKFIRKADVIGSLLIRLAIGVSFLIGSSNNSLFAPELPISSLPFAGIVKIILLIISFMIIFGIFTELSAFAALLIFTLGIFSFGTYMTTYLSYLGEIIVLLLFGSRFFSIDKLLFGQKLLISKFEKLKHLEIPIVRILYGIALIYAGYSIKFLHQSIPIMVYNEYNLKQIFHANAEFIAAGAGISEIAIGLFILIGFCQKLTSTIMFIFLVLSLLYFKEAVWPHFILFGITISIFINSSDVLTVDHYLIPWVRGIIHKVTSIAKK